ncbi:MAG: hypothetical protein LBG58_13570 [Planctomycetaceae bacterium]|jgi:hypothetical protein|nr:hypothetical protein [Planctomycetaceae bacterium]
MKSKLRQFVQNKFLRWLMSTVILFYVLVPQVGACHCSDCRCKEHSNSNSNPATITVTAAVEDSPPSTCCSQNQKKSHTSVSIADVSTNTLLTKKIKKIKTQSCCARMPVDRVSHDLNDLNQELNQESPVCPCSLKQAYDQPNFILPSSILLRKSLDELLIDGSFLYSFSVSTIPVVKIVSFYQPYESPVSRLPVRLHLLLLVLLN